MSEIIGSTGRGSRITSNTGVNLALSPVSLFIMILGDDVKFPALKILTDFILPKGSQLYESCVPFAGSMTISSTPQL